MRDYPAAVGDFTPVPVSGANVPYARMNANGRFWDQAAVHDRFVVVRNYLSEGLGLAQTCPSPVWPERRD